MTTTNLHPSSALRTRFRLAATGLYALALVAGSRAAAQAQEGSFLSEEEAPRAVFAEADTFTRRVIPASVELREQMRTILGATAPSLWEDEYVVFTALAGNQVVGRAVIVEEIGKHRPITFVVGVRSDGSVSDVAVMAYREAYGGEVRSKRFLKQYRDKASASPLRTFTDIQNIAGATLSVDAASRAVKKALAVAQAAFPPARASHGGGEP